jgi:inactivated superfamily I helicase
VNKNPHGAELLHLLAPWREGAVLAAGQCLLSDEWRPRTLLAEQCPTPGCHSLILGCSDEQLAERLAVHRRWCPS